MKTFLLSVFFCLSALSKGYSQDISYKTQIDSVLTLESKNVLKGTEIVGDSTDMTYFYKQNRHELCRIEVRTLGNDRTMWLYTYYFINDKMVKLNKSNRQTLQAKKEATYYFKNDKLAFRQEDGTQIENLQVQLNAAINMRRKASKY